MLARRQMLAGIVAAVLASTAPVFAADPPTGNADLQQTLVFGLRPRTPNEEAFVTLVVTKVQLKQLPLELVIATFRWAQPKKPYPFPYFERAMRERARLIGVSL